MWRRFTRFQHAGSILHKQNVLRSMVQQAQFFAHLEKIVHAQLPDAAVAHCRLANYNEGRLVLVIDNAMWATRLRYQQNQLLERLAQHAEFTGLQRIQLKVRPGDAFNSQQGEKSSELTLSGEAGDALLECAAGIRDPRLRAALERLASRSRQS